MKELNGQDKLNEKQSLETVQKQQQQVELKWIDDLRPLRGHKLWEINNNTRSVTLAEFQPMHTVDFIEFERSGSLNSQKKVITKSGYSYVSALTKQSALERFLNGKGSAKLTEKKSITIF